MEDIKSEIRQNGKDSGDCPFCGFGEITDVDHFLPSSSYPEYSIYTNNLIPSCHRCNNLKNNSGLVNFHPYFDNVINSEFLVCNLTNKRQTVLFSGRFSIDYSLLTTTESSLVNDVYGKLDLIERFESVVTNHVEGIRTDYDKIRNFVTIQIFLQSHYDSKLQLHGPNHYKTATAKSLLNNVSLLSTIW
ncbi:MAG: hypothetical protein BM556_05615 [Bacteriovorax sp. MedPE-SWde]|nr:MAG: hypothetical protein BM556_05615 [Bacteriovorax sp. MedPE-SWde]